MLEALLRDIQHGCRALRKSSGQTVTVALTIALGVGVNTSTFSLVNGFLIRPFPAPSPERLTVLAVQETSSPLGALGFSYPAFVAFRQQAAPSCEALGQVLAGSMGLTADDRTEQLSISAVTSNYFSGLGIKPFLGRLILPNEGETPGELAVLVLGHSYWQKRFGSDPAVIGKQVRMNGKIVEIVGVVPKDFHGSFAGFELDGYVPLSTVFPSGSGANFWTDRNRHVILAMGRLQPGVNRENVQALFDVIARRLAEQYPATDKGFSVRVIPERLARPIPYANNSFLLISALFLALAVLVLLLACTNVANILAARASERLYEMATRAALGASRVRLLSQLLTETMLLAILGGALGTVLGTVASRLSSAIHLPAFPLHLDFRLDWLVFMYAFGAVILTGILVGLSPALSVTRADINLVLHQGRHQSAADVGRRRVRADLMVVQVAGSFVLLIVAGLFIRSLQNAGRVDLGFDPQHVLNVTLDPRQNNYNENQTKTFYHELESKVRALPGVQSVSLASSVPISYFPTRQRVYLEGRHLLPDRLAPEILFNRVDEDYFKTMRIPLLFGRVFADSDNETAPLVAITNHTMASRLWPREQPIGKRFSVNGESGSFMEIVGVVGDGKYQTIAEDPQPSFYVPMAQGFNSRRVLQIRSSIPTDSLIRQVQQAIGVLELTMPVVDIRTMQESLEGATGFFMFRLGAWVAASIGTLGVVLAVVGPYGVVSYAVARRTREIGIRMALGARPQQILTLIAGQGMKIVLGGVFTGLVAAWALTRVMAHLLVGIRPSDPFVYIGVSILLSAVVLLACGIPARRAAGLNPIAALRDE